MVIKMHKDLIKNQNCIVNDYVNNLLNNVVIKCDDIKLAGKICNNLHNAYGYRISDGLLNIKSLDGYFIIINSKDKLVDIDHLQIVLNSPSYYSILSDKFVDEILSVAQGTIIPSDIESLMYNRFFSIKGDINDKELLISIGRGKEHFKNIKFINNKCLINAFNINDDCSILKDNFAYLISFVEYMKSINNKSKNTIEFNNVEDACSVSYNKDFIIMNKCLFSNFDEYIRLVLKISEIRCIVYNININYYQRDEFHMLTVTFNDGTRQEAYISESDFNIIQKYLMN